MRRPASALCLLLRSCPGGIQLDPLGGSMGHSYWKSWIDPLAFAVVTKEHFEHVVHASALIVRYGLEGELERWRNAQV